MLYTVAERPEGHPKGPKTLMTIPYGRPIPAGVILGKGTVITVKDLTEEDLNEHRFEVQHQEHRS